MASSSTVKEYRLKQIELLIKLIDMYHARILRLSVLLTFGNAGAIATAALILKDLNSRFDEKFVLRAAELFVVGLIAGACLSFLTFTSSYTRRGHILDLILNNEDVSKVKESFENPDNLTIMVVAVIISVACFFGGVVLILNYSIK